MGRRVPRRSMERGEIVLVVMVIGYLVASLAPFRLDLPQQLGNGAKWRDGAVVFETPGVVTEPDWPGSSLSSADTFEIVVAATSAGTQTGPARIFSLSAGIHSQSLIIAQTGDDLSVRVRQRHPRGHATPTLSVSDVFADGRSHTIQVNVTPDVVVILVDGTEAERVPSSDALGVWDDDHRPLLGNEHGGTRPWTGTISHAVATIDGQSWDLLERGIIPATYWQLPDRWRDARNVRLSWPPIELLHAMAVLVIALLAMRRWRDRPVFVLIGVLGLVVGTFATKFVVANRHPSLADIVLEVLGMIVGAWWCRRHMLRSSQGEIGS